MCQSNRQHAWRRISQHSSITGSLTISLALASECLSASSDGRYTRLIDDRIPLNVIACGTMDWPALGGIPRMSAKGFVVRSWSENGLGNVGAPVTTHLIVHYVF